ncbi:tRNA (adenine(58)-N(1))-methyltransferase non-catalytic subunit TRM6 [Culicoides brevitarsis]|uniref:tRNA (adenine(58)-N(1))-methyltransferase non-catalytic subunit TRM6 n=1 Tax=Culicoides brevitarsis TaxID=469753 RepID=UPI00307C0991
MEKNDDVIKVGDYIIIQRQKFTKLYKFASLETTVTLGKETLELRQIEGQKFFTTFKMVSKNPANPKKRFYSLEACSEITSDIRAFLNNTDSGQDNRDIKINDNSQNLSQQEIEALRKSGASSTNIIGQLVENSKTFTSKTEFGQEKYLKKKERKYFEYVQVRKPSIRLLAEMFYRQDPEKILFLRQDTLSQLISYSNVNESGTYLLYESGTQGLLPATLMNSIGANTKGRLLHMHQGPFGQKLALQALNLEEEHMKRCLSVNIFSSLKMFHNREEEIVEESEPAAKKIKLDDEIPTENGDAKKKEKPKWYFENLEAVKMLDEKVDGLVIVAREHPWSILMTLLPFVKPNRNIVIYHNVKEVLTDVFLDLKAGSKVTAVKLTSNWMRNYQVLPNRTHPEVQMGGNSGYLLTGIVVES